VCTANTKPDNISPVSMYSPEQFPDPWLFDTEALLRELDRVRELIPLHNDTFGPTNTAVSAVWELREHLRYLIGLRIQMMADWQRKGTQTPAEPASESRPKEQILPSDGKRRHYAPGFIFASEGFVNVSVVLHENGSTE
jgi:hypothetical protein